MKNYAFNAFLIALILAVGYLCFLIFRPFLTEIVVAMILVTIFYGLYERLVGVLRGRKKLAGLIMCTGISLLIIIPIIQIFLYSANKSDEAFIATKSFLNSMAFDRYWDGDIFDRLGMDLLPGEDIRNFLLTMAGGVRDWLIAEAGGLLVGTANFIFSLFMIIFIMYFFFVDGKEMLIKLMHLTPLPNRYDREIFKKFKDVSYSNIAAAFLIAIAEGLTGAFAFLVVGLPAFFPGLAMGVLSLLPYIGAAFVWFPAGVYLLFNGQIWEGIFMLAWGFTVISLIDNLIRAYVIKGKAQVNPIFVIISFLGGLAVFGFWGIFFGPLIISLAATIIHIYEMEYGEGLERQ